MIHAGDLREPKSVCLAWYALDVFFTSSTIMHLTVIAIDRYVALQHPLRYNATRRHRYMCCKIAFVWIFSLLLAGPYFFFASWFAQEETHDGLKGCGTDSVIFVLPAVIFSFYIPFAIMTFSWYRTVQILRERTKQALFSQTLTVRASARDTIDTHRNVNDTELCENGADVTERTPMETTANGERRGTAEETSLTSNTEECEERFTQEIERSRARNAHRPSRAMRQHAQCSNRAIRVLSVLYTVFTFCYLPFFLSITARAICRSARCSPLDTISKVFEVLGYCASVLNPIVYNVFSTQFRSAFHSLMHCR